MNVRNIKSWIVNDVDGTITMRPTWKAAIVDFIGFFFMYGYFTIWSKVWNLTVKATTLQISTKQKFISGRALSNNGTLVDTSLPIKQITSVVVDKGIMGGAFDYGTLIINTAQGTIRFPYVEAPTMARDLVLGLMNI